MQEKIRLGVSACLLGQRVRYDGGHKLDPLITETLGPYVDFFPVCPESEAGLGVPREPMHLAGDPSRPRLITNSTGVDRTEALEAWATRFFAAVKRDSFHGFILKSRSPSCALRGVPLHTQAGHAARAPGLFAARLMARFPLMPMEEEERLQKSVVRENFIERIFVYRRWLALGSGRRSRTALMDFHRRHKLLVMAHSAPKATALDRLLADDSLPLDALFIRYGEELQQALRIQATLKKQANALQHAMGYFKRRLDREQREEISDAIVHYHLGELPLIVPITLLHHYALRLEETYLLEQWYLQPEPLELLLRNHA